MSERTPAIRVLASPRPDLLVFEVLGRIERPDIEFMAGRVALAFDRFEDTDILILMTDFDGAAPGAVFDLKAIATETRSLRSVRKYGVVGAPEWVRAMIEAADFIIPVDSRTFPEGGLAEAWQWIDPVSPGGG